MEIAKSDSQHRYKRVQNMVSSLDDDLKSASLKVFEIQKWITQHEQFMKKEIKKSKKTSRKRSKSNDDSSDSSSHTSSDS